MSADRVREPARLDNLSLRDQLRIDRLPRRLLQMMLGLTGFGVSLALLLESGLGGAPWDVLHAAIAERVGLTVGTVSIAVSFVVLLLWIPLRERLGLGTLANALWVGASIDLGMLVLPTASTPTLAVVMMLAGVVLNGLSDGVYIGAQLGAGARDGLMTALSRVLSRPVGPLRIGLEVIVLATGWALGGPLGVGTVVYAIALGPIVQWTLHRVTIPVRAAGGAAADGEPADLDAADASPGGTPTAGTSPAGMPRAEDGGRRHARGTSRPRRAAQVRPRRSRTPEIS